MLYSTEMVERRLPGSRARRSYVYFIQAKEGGPVKIGWTVNPAARLKALQAASPYKLVVRFTLPGTQRLEHYLHERFAPWRLEGEWFEPQADMPGCMYDGFLSTADWLEEGAKVRAFEREAQEEREAMRESRQRKELLPDLVRRKSGRVIDVMAQRLLDSGS